MDFHMAIWTVIPEILEHNVIQRGERWVARAKDYPLTAYGDSREAASLRLHQMAIFYAKVHCQEAASYKL